MNFEQQNILLVGCGAMGSALVQGWAACGLKSISIITPHESSLHSLTPLLTINWYAEPKALAEDFHPTIVVFAVKPSVLDTILINYQRFTHPDTLLISVAAGKRVEFYYNLLGSHIALIHAMPNLPVAYGQGMTVLFASQQVKPEQHSLADALFSSLGEAVFIEDEGLFDAVTAVSGCGPAYLYLLVESLSQAGIKVGLPKPLAEKLARQAMIGAGILLAHSKETAEILKKKVTSPGGVTEAALKILEEETSGMPFLIKQAIKVATEHCYALSKDQ